MRILHISKYYFPYIGGVENICKYLIEGMPKHKMAVVCFNEGRENQVDMVNGVTVYRVGTWINISRQALSLAYFPILRRAIKDFKPDVIHFHWANPFPAAVLLAVIPKQVKLIIHWHMDIIKQKVLYPFIRPFEIGLLKRADLVVVTSPQYRDGSKPLQAYKSKIRVVPNAMDESNFVQKPGDEEQIKAIQTKYKNNKIVFFVGRHIQYKGLQYLIEAEKYIKENCVIVIAGNGPLTDELKAMCNSDRVYFIGRLSNNEIRWYHHAASVFAFPSITKNEAFGIALAEAMYCYTPAVTFTIPGSGVNWVNQNGITGIEVNNKDVIAYAHAIDILLSDDTKAILMGYAGHKRVVDNFTITQITTAMDRCYCELSQ